MILPKIILIGKIWAIVGATVIVGGVVMQLYKDTDTLPEQRVIEQYLLEDYKKLSETIKIPEANLLNTCAKPYVDKIFKLTADLDNIKKIKQRTLDNMESEYEYNKAMSNPLPEPGTQQLDFESGNPIPIKEEPMSDEEFNKIMSEYIPEIGSETPYLDSSNKPVDIIALYDKLIREIQIDIDLEIDKIKPACTKVAEEEKKDCESPCRNYIHRCLSLVPNANENLFKQGLDSCIKECKVWNNTKIQCITNAKNCQNITDICGL